MKEFLASLEKVVEEINGYLSDYILVILLIGIGLFFTIRTRFVQVRCFGEGMKRVFGNFSLHGGKGKGGISSFQALATAIAAQVGTGNIVGACGAILIGGPGAIFWMWVIAFLGMATIYAEAVLAQETKTVDADGNVQGGPVYYIKTAFKGKFGKFLAVFFAIAAVLALGFMGSMVQSNSIAGSCNTAFGIPTWVMGLVVTAISAIVFLGGVNRLASVTEKIVPFMAGLYIVGSFIILIANIKVIPETFGLIFKYAFTPQALIGGGIGAAIKTAISQGAKRGLFSNEAGMGSTPHAHALAKVEKPHDQGVAAMIGVFIDTFIVLNLTALVVISSLFTGDGALSPNGAIYSAARLNPEAITDIAEAAGVTKVNMAQLSFGSIFGDNIGAVFVAICLFFFAFSTILSWNLFGKLNAEYLFGKKSVWVYTVIALAFIFIGTVIPENLVWDLTDFFNYLMVLPNAIALIALAGLVKKASRTNKIKKIEQ